MVSQIDRQAEPDPGAGGTVGGLLWGMVRLVRACVLVVAWLGAAVWVRGAEPRAQVGPGAPVMATRAEVARAYIRFEMAYAAKPPAAGRERSAIHRRFDALTGVFFSGDNAKTARELDRLTGVLDAGAPAFVFPARGALSRPAARMRGEWLARLDGVKAAGEEHGAAVRAARSRVGLVVDEPDDGMLIQTLSDPARLAGEVEAEVAAIEAGRDPYRRRLGDWWMAVHVADGVEMPVRVFAPSAASFERRPPLALVIALHGAGGDENLFMEAYGRGKIKALADEHGFVVASTSTTMMAGQPRALDALVADLHAHYGLDERRVYVVGHSMGAGAAALLASTRREVIAGAVCIAGGPQRVPTGPVAPMLVWGAELDSMIPARRLRAAAEGAKAAGLPVEYREAAGAGHVLVVGDVLAEAVAWLLKQKRAEDGAGGKR